MRKTKLVLLLLIAALSLFQAISMHQRNVALRAALKALEAKP